MHLDELSPSRFWGKYDEDSKTWHPLIAHSADVAAVAEALLEKTLLGRRLARLAGRDELPPAWIARLGWLAAIHDFGKANRWFQQQIRPGQPRYGHVETAWTLLLNQSSVTARLVRLLDLQGKTAWFETEQAKDEAFSTTICHHGRAYPVQAKSPDDRPWQAVDGVDPLDEVERLVAAADGWFPGAFAPDAEPLPDRPAFWHGWNGVLTLADWLGSTPTFFPFTNTADADRMPEARRLAEHALVAVGLDVDAPRRALGGAAPSFERLVGLDARPRPAQAATGALPIDPKGAVSVLEAPTGEGKTEAALWRFFALFVAGEVDGLYFALPTRTAATQIYRRVCAIVERVFPDADARPLVAQAVPGYVSADGLEAEILGRFEVLWPDDAGDRQRERAWAAERPKRFLAATIALGTVDQALLSALRVRHAHLRAAPLTRQLLVVDEVHASDAYMSRLLEFVLDHHRAAGGHALLMSATLGGSTRSALLGGRRRKPTLDECLEVPYPVLAHRPHGGEIEYEAVAAAGERARAVTLDLRPILDDPAAIAALALDAAERGARVLVIRNTVGAAVETQAALEGLAAERDREDCLFAVDTERGPVATLHHARFARVDRERLDAAIERVFDPRRKCVEGRVAVATQTVQQSLDLDSDLLISDLCPLDVLLQRIGRLHRHAGPPRPDGFESPRCVVAVPAERDLTTFTKRGAHGLGSVYPDLRGIEATWQELEARDALHVPDECRELVERTTHPDALAATASALGDAWEKHQHKTWGALLTNRKLAKSNAIDWTKPFHQATLGDAHEKIRTRLGDEDVRVRFAENETLEGPFDAILKEVVLPHFQLPKEARIDKDEVAEEVVVEPGVVRFRFAGRSFVYDRFGIRPDS